MKNINPLKLEGIKSLIPFLNFLERNHVHYHIAKHRDDTVMVAYTLLGCRVELDFFDDHIEYSNFKGNEDVLEDQEQLFSMIKDFVMEGFKL